MPTTLCFLQGERKHPEEEKKLGKHGRPSKLLLWFFLAAGSAAAAGGALSLVAG